MRKRNKTGGRVSGTPNKLTKSHRELMNGIFENEIQSGKIESELKKLDGKDYLDAIFKLSGFVLPKLNSIDITNPQVNKPIIIDWSEPKEEIDLSLLTDEELMVLESIQKKSLINT